MGSRVPIVVAVLLALCGARPTVARPSKAARDYEEHMGRGHAATVFGAWAPAEQEFRAAVALAPDHPVPRLYVARSAAWQGQNDEALEALREAFDRGLCKAHRLRRDLDLQSLRDDARFDALIRDAEAMSACQPGPPTTRRPELDLEKAPAFASLRKLLSHYERRSSRLGDASWSYAPRVWGTRWAAEFDERYAAITRYLRDHPDARDREAAAWQLVQIRTGLHDLYAIGRRWHEYGIQARGEVERFLTTYPASEHRGDAELLLAFAKWYCRPDGGSEDYPWNEEDRVVLEGDLARVAESYAGTTVGGRALALRIWVAQLGPDLARNDEILALIARLSQEYGENREVLATARLRDVFVQPAAVDAFGGTDRRGRTWTTADLEGNVTLLHFCSTLSDYCKIDVPAIKAAWERYRDRGFQVVGIVGRDDFDGFEEMFDRWTERYGMQWPHILVNARKKSSLFHVFEAPPWSASLLLDRSGNMIATQLRGDVLLERIEGLLGDSQPARRDEDAGTNR